MSNYIGEDVFSSVFKDLERFDLKFLDKLRNLSNLVGFLLVDWSLYEAKTLDIV